MRKAVWGLTLGICLLASGCQSLKETAAGGGNPWKTEIESTFATEKNTERNTENTEANSEGKEESTSNAEEPSIEEVSTGETHTEEPDVEQKAEQSHVEESHSAAAAGENGGFLLPDSDRKLLTVREIQSLSKEELRLAKNEIYARHGRQFVDQKLQAYFNQCIWYHGTVQPDAFDDAVLSETELANIKLLDRAQTAKEAKGEKGTKLTQKELEYYTAFVNDMSNNGFLGSKYDRPQDVNLDEVFYNGCGVSGTLTEEERKRVPEIFTDYTKVTTAQVNEILNKKLGLELKDMTYPLQYLYVEEGDFYFFQHGDTNYMPYTCTEGTWVEDAVLELRCRAEYNEEYYNCVVRLKKAGNEMYFVSNHAQ